MDELDPGSRSLFPNPEIQDESEQQQELVVTVNEQDLVSGEGFPAAAAADASLGSNAPPEPLMFTDLSENSARTTLEEETTSASLQPPEKSAFADNSQDPLQAMFGGGPAFMPDDAMVTDASRPSAMDDSDNLLGAHPEPFQVGDVSTQQASTTPPQQIPHHQQALSRATVAEPDPTDGQALDTPQGPGSGAYDNIFDEQQQLEALSQFESLPQTNGAKAGQSVADQAETSSDDAKQKISPKLSSSEAIVPSDNDDEEEEEEGEEDDYDGDDVEILPSKFATKSAEEISNPVDHKPPSSTAANDLPLERHIAIRNIVMGSPSKSVARPVATSSVGASSANEQSSQQKEEERTEKKGEKKETKEKGKRKKQSKPLTRILVSKKDSSNATALLQDKIDLSDHLPREDCLFLAEKFWIFTVEQLSFALQMDTSQAASTDSNDRNLTLRDEIVDKLSRSDLLHSQTSLVSKNEPSSKSPTLQSSVSNDKLFSVPGQEAKETISNSTLAEQVTQEASVAGLSKSVETGSCEKKQSRINEIDATTTTSETTIPPSSNTQNKPDADREPLKTTVAEVAPSFVQEAKVAAPADADNAICTDDGELRKMAQQRLDSWAKALADVDTDGHSTTSVEERFRLDGAIRTLFSTGTLNFLASISVKTLWNFLAMKKTETGAVCELLRIWRSECKLIELPDLALAKHFLGLAFRIEKAISSVPHVSPKERAWIQDPIVSMSGAAKHFVIQDQGIVSASAFTKMKTKKLSSALKEWREKRGLAPLKGSGKVAMISGWKTIARESVKAELYPGRVVDLESALMSDKIIKNESIVTPAPRPKRKRRKKTDVKGAAYVGRTYEIALHSNIFLEQVLGYDIAKLLESAGIFTPTQLFSAEINLDSDLFRVMNEAGKLGQMSTLESLGKIVDVWRHSLQQDLDKLRRNAPGVSSSLNLDQNTSAVINRSKREAANQSVHPSEVHSMEKQPSSTDPIAALSPVSIQFLESIGIFTASDFLSARTTEISEHFIRWRAAEGKPELKGLGAIASVSGWKTIVRKRAKDMGLGDLAVLEPSRKTRNKASGGVRKTRPRATTRKNAVKEEVKVDDFLAEQKQSDISETAGSLSDDGRKLIAVQGLDSPAQFVFELSIRKRAVGCPRDLFITHKGCGARTVGKVNVKSVELEYDRVGEDNLHATNLILASVPVARMETAGSVVDDCAPFSVAHPGGGLIELGRHKARPLRKQDLSRLKLQIQALISDIVSPQDASKIGGSAEGNYNVLINKVGYDKFQYLLHLAYPIEKGQTLAVRFPSVDDALQSKIYSAANYSQYHVIDEATRTLCLEDLQTLLFWLRDDVLPTTRYAETLRGVASLPVSFKGACERRRKLYWVSRCISSAIGKDRSSSETIEACNTLYFGRASIGHEDDQCSVPPMQQAEFSSALAAQIANEMYCAMEFDSTCGVARRAEWSPRAVEFLKAVIRCISQVFATVQDNASSFSTSIEIALSDFLKNNCDWMDSLVPVQEPPERNIENDTIQQDYQDAMALIAESPYDATVAESAPVESVRNGERKLPVASRELSWKIVSSAMSSFSRIVDNDHDAEEDFDVKTILSVAKPLVVESLAAPDTVPISYKMTLPTPVSHETECIPNSYPFFLGIVWPALRKLGWSLHAGSSPSEVSFIPKPKGRKRVSSMKHDHDSKRQNRGREVNTIGLGAMPKTTKRLLAAVSGQEEICGPSTSISSNADGRQLTVEDVLTRFRAWLLTKATNEEEHLRSAFDEKLQQILRAIEGCFDACSPMLSSLDGTLPPPTSREGLRPVSAYSCEYLMQFLFILPSVLRQAELPAQNTIDCMAICRDLLDFITANHKELLEERFVPPNEKYARLGLPTEPSFLDSRLESLLFKEKKPAVSNDSAKVNAVELTELVFDEDKPGLTDFIYTVLGQAIPYRATAEDVRKKRHRIYEGYPGVVCRHCMGAGGQGKYFFSSVESLSTSYTVLEAHFLKCAPEEVRQRIRASRLRHVEQRKSLRTGSQQAFFNRLWDRLRTSKIAGKKGGIQVAENLDREDDVRSASNESEAGEYSDHISVLDYIRTGDIRTSRELEEAIDRYYSCLDYAGRVYNTPSMPKHFSSVWLLAKVLPKDQHHTPQRNVG